ncbi:MAG: cytochrome C [Hyphomicrobiales bacterium]|nr:MAG: cytochrome C [Hyphomicrobiales bacterium]
MKRVGIVAALVLALAGTGAGALWLWPIGEPVVLADRKGDASRGAYLARMAGCIACHTNSAKGGAPLAGGLALETKFGTFYTPNLTPDEKHGLGAWSLDDFARAVRQGVSPSGEPYYPAFPYPFYRHLSDQDVADLWAAFRMLPAVAAPSRPQALHFPFSFRPGLKLWRAAFLSDTPLSPDPGKSEQWNRGQYIVRGPAHCGACHTPRNLAGARLTNRRLEGNPALPEGGSAPAISTAALHESGWKPGDIAYALETGIMPDGDVFGSSMAKVVDDGTSFLTDADRKAVATYLLDEEPAK